jgi:hypothetical protein
VANTLTEVVPQLLAQGLLTLRSACVMPRLVNRSVETIAASKGEDVEVPIPLPMGDAEDVQPSHVPPAPGSVGFGKVKVPLDQWKKKDFHMTDKQQLEVMAGTIPMQAAEAVKSIANSINRYVFRIALARSYMHAGTAGTTPFSSDFNTFKQIRTKLNASLAPEGDRRVIVDPIAEGEAAFNELFLHADKRGSTEGLISGTIGQKFGSQWFMDQQVPQHVNGTAGAGTKVSGAQLAGANPLQYTDQRGTLLVDGAGANATFTAGTLFTIAGHAQQYVVAQDAVADGAGAAALAIVPRLAVNVADDAALTIVPGHTANLYMHRDAVAFAMRPLADTVPTELGGAMVMSQADPVSGLVLRLQVTRQYMQTVWTWDALYGGIVVRPEFIGRILG